MLKKVLGTFLIHTNTLAFFFDGFDFSEPEEEKITLDLGSACCFLEWTVKTQQSKVKLTNATK